MQYNLTQSAHPGASSGEAGHGKRRINSRRTPTLGLGVAALFLILGTGCYTQLYTGDYVQRDADRLGAYPAYGQGFGAGDTLAPNRQGDTLLADPRPVTVIAVNDPYVYYRGYSDLEWNYPFLSFEYYSRRHREYDHPYWWSSHDRVSGDYVPSHNGGGGGPPRSILYSQNPGYSAPHRGQRGTGGNAGTPSASSGAGVAQNHGSQKSSSTGSGSWFSFGSNKSESTSGSGSSSTSSASSSSSGSSSLGGEKSSPASSGSASSSSSESSAPEVHKGRRE